MKKINYVGHILLKEKNHSWLSIATHIVNEFNNVSKSNSRNGLKSYKSTQNDHSEFYNCKTFEISSSMQNISEPIV